MKTKDERAELFRQFQNNIKNSNTFETGKEYLLELRKDLIDIYSYIFEACDYDDFYKMPLSKDKTIGYYLYHLTRIEDITSNTLIKDTEQLFFLNDYDKSLHSPITTTGNELTQDALVDFSKSLDIDKLRCYTSDVMLNTNDIIKCMTFQESKTKVSKERKDKLLSLESVSTDENAFWLVDYWCNKTFAGLMLMPFSRHQLLHLNACMRIISRLKK